MDHPGSADLMTPVNAIRIVSRPIAAGSSGWHWLGLIGFVLLLTAFFRSCPLYSVVGISTGERQIGRS
ncbi:MAG: DUF2892 domain-containing protein [Tardiphaga sp.]